ncbi:haloacid dehalogenase type II [Sneathiella glossodoripedis]|uniref:haloacid dehalogenase type II n=1 Tax=Sneathiella glossodoripedis TaxID=418853 RepID=UPI00047075E1|nr:haloacid dehalogenase type II [Sneathiella glossodoripedis]
MTDTRFPDIKACVFDAYGTLFDVDAAARQEKDRLGENWKTLSDIWRLKQLQYTWLRSLQGNYTDFWKITEDALDFAMEAENLNDKALKARLMDLYLTLSAYEEVPQTLKKLKEAGIKCAILSNGSPQMLEAAVENAGISSLLDGVYSVAEVKVFKPHPKVYELAVDRLGVDARHISFQSSNGWDAYSAKDFGFNTIWCNRFDQAAERLPSSPDCQIKNLTQMFPIVGVT